MSFQSKPPVKTALVYAVDLLAVRPYSVKQLTDKLKRRGYSEIEIEETLTKLLSRHYLDDTDLCQRQYLSYLNEGRRSITAIRYKLLEKGFCNEDIENAFTETDVDTQEYEYNTCLKLLNAHFKPSNADKQKCQAYLYRKGFSASNIRLATEDFLENFIDY